jgi:Protein of unknown function (DUF1176)
VLFAVIRLLRLLPLLPACASTFAAATAAEFKNFRDWYVGCDNLRNCSAFGFEADDPSSAWLRIERSGAPAASARITIAADVNENVKVELAFDDAAVRGLPAGPLALDKGDDQSFGRVTVDDPAAVETLIAGLRKAQTILVGRTDPPGAAKSDPQTSRISLSGAVAALLWIDEQQQRLGTATALVRRGDKPASSVPPQPKAPAVQAAKAPAGAAPKLGPADLRVLTAKAKALCGEDERRTALEDSARLDRDTSLRGFSCKDNSGAYNLASVFLIVPDNAPQAARPVKFAFPAALAAKAPPDVLAINASFDQKTMTLSTFNKGRGLGDCGAAEDWVFDGQAFQLALLRSMPHCKGITDGDWPVHYRSERR